MPIIIGRCRQRPMMIEDYIPGFAVAWEGMLEEGSWRYWCLRYLGLRFALRGDRRRGKLITIS